MHVSLTHFALLQKLTQHAPIKTKKLNNLLYTIIEVKNTNKKQVIL